MTTRRIIPIRRSSIGRRVRMRFPPDGDQVVATIVDEVTVRFLGIGGFRWVEACAQLLRIGHGRRVRIGYYIIGRKPRMRGRWVWGQSALVIPPRALRKLVTRVRKKGWLNREAA